MSELPARVVAATPAELQDLAARVAEQLRAGDLVILRGPLGAGKTTFAQGVGAALGVAERLTSPTFVIAREHRGRVPVIHVDAYRLGGIDELDDLDLDAEVHEAVTLVEWGEGLAEVLADDGYLVVDIDRESADGEQRVVHLRAAGPRWAGVIGREARS
ncbi:tRNA (adenosine(37)-N6)-threonylcarbamoyltransferase complex ATPase subunit type 1 TsaE [Cumulibacter manganitolerans]|uniref:tRNA (adenosine(37)-N6)-threonylcarbamoyltransferase complex ATPase subunit type 1 TsaE n=1 Tax=Cumulibacter manganitolerans TaxID=1884992 RepID=UPI001298182C|nr:tRNA (adenosine(37)-N6)-threonylcarbamoyltransferase complex ATPase subunit type 1 TsaE [Cumulibacter manganitolerans]